MEERATSGVLLGGFPRGSNSIRSTRASIRGMKPRLETSFKPTYSDRMTFGTEDWDGVEFPHHDPLVIRGTLAGTPLTRIMIDSGSTVNLIFPSALRKIGVPPEKIMIGKKTVTSLSGFEHASHGTVKILVVIGPCDRSVEFHIVNSTLALDAVLGTPWIHELEAVPSTVLQCIKIPTKFGVCTIRGDQKIARRCFLDSREKENSHPVMLASEPMPEKGATPSQPPSNLLPANLDPLAFDDSAYEKVPIDESNPERQVSIGKNLSLEIRTGLIDLLKKNVSTFAWSSEDMVGVSPEITTHRLNVDPTFKPIKQKRRKLGPERAEAVNEEIEKLLKKGAITEVRYPEWLANPVVVKKKNGKWRICIDFKDLNKACPKDCYPTPDIERLVDSTAGNELLSFMDAFSGYNQIMMHPDDREKTAFITNRGTYCYRVMPFGLKNAGATYQRLVNRMFADQLGKTMEVYIDDMLVKSQVATDHVRHLQDCFDILNKYGMKLNPDKCTFAVKSGEFLGYIVTKRGIEANPRHITALLELPSPRTPREVQRLTGRIAALNRFISRSTDRCLPFYQLLKGKKEFDWDERAEKAFQELKAYLSKPPVLAKPTHGEPLLLYIAVTTHAISGVLVREERGEQQPVFYISKSLLDAETRYPALEKLALAVVTAARKLRPYFQTHPIAVVTEQPIRSVLHSPSQSGRLAKWAIELSEYDLEYRGRTSIKSQVLADFLLELPSDTKEEKPLEEEWTLFVDGSSSCQGSGIGIWLKSPTGEVLEQSFRLAFKASNNEAEYEALIAGLRLARGMKIRRIHAHCDSQLVVNQFHGEFATKNERMESYLALTRKLTKSFSSFELTRVPRNENTAADSLATRASASDPDLQRVIPIETIERPSIEMPDVAPATLTLEDLDEIDREDEAEDEEIGEDDWRAPIKNYLLNGTLPKEKWAARRLKAKAARYLILDNFLFKRTPEQLILHCIGKGEARRVMEETHGGEGGNHSGGRSMSIKIRKHGYYWPTMVADCESFVERCEMCQRHAPIIHTPTEHLTASTPGYPFMRWGMDIVGPLTESNGKVLLLVMTDYFTKWVEAKAYDKIKDKQVEEFVWSNIICRHGLPYEIVTDNGSQFISRKFEAFCEKWKIRINNSTPRYPQCNGQAESTNKTIIDGLKKRLREKKKQWFYELDGVLWSYRTTPRSATGQTPFSLSHGVEALAPAEIRVPTLRRSFLVQDPVLNEKKLAQHLMELEELRDNALLRIQNYQQIASRYYDKKVRHRPLSVGDLVLRKVFRNTEESHAGKLGIRWEGPYRITAEVRPGVYELQSMDGIHPPRVWNARFLKKYYPAS